MKTCRICGSSEVLAFRLKQNDAICGPCRNELNRKYRKGDIVLRHPRHGGVGTPEYKIWSGIKERCLHPEHPQFHNYGGRGITICDRWRKSFPAFLEDMGQRPSAKHSIDRIDNDKGYSPDNCRWATVKEQAANRRPRERWRSPRPNPIEVKVGDHFGRLEVMEDLGCPVKEHMFLCLCICGNLHRVMRGSLVRGDTRSCGCLKQEWLKGPRGLRPGSRRYLQAQRSARPIEMDPMPDGGK